MSNLEHYFENLLFEGKDCRGDVNKNTLTKEEQEAVEICAQYVIYTLFCGQDDFKKFIHSYGELEPVKHGRWEHDKDDELVSGYCSVCGWTSCICETDVADMPFCPNCGASMMDGGENGTD